MTSDPRRASAAPGTEPEADGLDAPVDDRVIARALRLSLLALVGLLLAALAIWLALRGEPKPVRIEDAAVAAPQAPASVPVQPPALPFADVTQAWGIGFRHENGAYGERLLPETMGSGVAVADLDGDQRPDLLFVNARPWPWRAQEGAVPTAALYRNLGNGRFEDITAGSGLDVPLYGMGVAVADLDGDGLPEVFLSAVGEDRLFRNLGGGRFADITAEAGVAGEAGDWSSSALFFDYDRDGQLDLFVLNYVRWSREIDVELDYRLTGVGRAYGPPTNYAGTHARLYRGLGAGRFEDVSATAGIQVDNPATGLPMGKGLGVVALDVDEDGWLDLAVANDTVQNFLFRNLGDGRFEEIGASSGLAFDNAGVATGAMGLDAAWYGNDADLAVAIGNFANEMTSFFVAQAGSGQFTDETIVSGIGPDSRLALSFGLFFFDADLDGRIDLFQTNGHIEDEINTVQPSQHYEQPSQLFWNCGPDCPRPYVHLAAAQVGALATPVVGRGAAYGDLDGDGDLDIVLTQTGRGPLLLRNDQASGHQWLRVRLEGTPGNRDAIGAVVSVRVGAQVQRQRQMPGRSYLSSVEPVLGFGLGTASQADELVVTWPDGRSTTRSNVAADSEIVVRQSE